jgi:hypothetical protein
MWKMMVKEREIEGGVSVQIDELSVPVAGTEQEVQ